MIAPLTAIHLNLASSDFGTERNLERKKEEKKLDLVLVMDGRPSVVGSSSQLRIGN